MTDRPAKITESYRGYAIEISLEEAMGGWDNLYYSVHREADGLEMVCNFTSGREDPQWLLGSLKEDIDDMIAHPENWIDEPEDGGGAEQLTVDRQLSWHCPKCEGRGDLVDWFGSEKACWACGGPIELTDDVVLLTDGSIRISKAYQDRCMPQDPGIVHVVFGAACAYTVTNTWPVYAFDSWAGAKAWAIKAELEGLQLNTNALKAIGKPWRSSTTAFSRVAKEGLLKKGANTYDPRMEIGEFGVRYFVEPLVLKRRPG